MLRLRSLFVSICLALATLPAAAQTVTGVVRVTDGDTIRLGEARIRLHGIDAPELSQICDLVDGREWRCGDWARQMLTQEFAGQRATCEVTDQDARYRRVVARCSVSGVDMGDWLVRNGVALAYRAYSLDYVDAEKTAIVATLGVWRSDFQTPADFRASRRELAVRAGSVPPDPNCPIKGNRSSNGHIYHMPGQADYKNTNIDESRGERWFCSAAEAENAGWRAARR